MERIYVYIVFIIISVNGYNYIYIYIFYARVFSLYLFERCNKETEYIRWYLSIVKECVTLRMELLL